MKRAICAFGLLCLASVAPAGVSANEPASDISEPAQTVEETVREYFADIPVMIEIARCESKFRQFADSGNVLRGGVGGQMVGVFQFFDRYHTSPAYDLGFDIETLEGNLEYARYVYEREGTSPWSSARHCFDVPLPLAVAPTAPLNSATVTDAVSTSTADTDAMLREKIALLQQIIVLLQTLLELRAQT